MNTPDLIHKLTGDLRPVSPMLSLGRRLGLWIAAGLVWGVIGLSWIGFRPDLTDKCVNVFFLLETAALVVLTGSVAVGSLKLAVPGETQSRSVFRWAIGAFATWMGVVLFRFYTEWTRASGLASTFDFHFVCSLLILGISIVPNMILAKLLARGYTLDTRKAGILAGLASGALGALCMQFVCTHERPLHIVAWHALPVVISSALGFGLARFVVSRQK